jgi:hypothetical protein
MTLDTIDLIVILSISTVYHYADYRIRINLLMLGTQKVLSGNSC